VVALAPGRARVSDEADWRDALVVVARGDVELECRGGSRQRFGRGDVLWLVGRGFAPFTTGAASSPSRTPRRPYATSAAGSAARTGSDRMARRPGVTSASRAPTARTTTASGSAATTPSLNACGFS
jgi:hypothetical protein